MGPRPGDDRAGGRGRETAGSPPDDPRPDPRPTWDQVAERYGDRIFNFAYRLTGNRDEAADLTQDVFVRVFGNLHRYEPGTFDGWLYRITKNLFLDRVRRQARLRTEPLSPEVWRRLSPAEVGPADIVERSVLEARLEQGLARLPEEFRLAVVLCDVEGLTYEEIAEVTGWPMGTVRSRIHRGRRRLREHLRRGGAPEGGDGDA